MTVLAKRELEKIQDLYNGQQLHIKEYSELVNDPDPDDDAEQIEKLQSAIQTFTEQQRAVKTVLKELGYGLRTDDNDPDKFILYHLTPSNKITGDYSTKEYKHKLLDLTETIFELSHDPETSAEDSTKFINFSAFLSDLIENH